MKSSSSYSPKSSILTKYRGYFTFLAIDSSSTTDPSPIALMPLPMGYNPALQELQGKRYLIWIFEEHVPYLYIVLTIVEIHDTVGISREIIGGSHTKLEQLPAKIDYGILVTDMYLYATWANIVHKIENNAEAAEEVTSCKLHAIF